MQSSVQFLAQMHQNGGGMMMWFGPWGMWLFWIVLIVALVWLATRAFGGGERK